MAADPCCPEVDFPGREKLVARLDEAVSRGDEHAVTAALRNCLCAMIRDRDVQLPACVHAPIVDHYARRELYRSDAHGYSVIAMTWGPGQGTPLHDHSGMWCVEGVWHGSLEITPYEMVEQRDGRFRFEARGTMNAGPGSAGSLIPPHEYHTIRNPSEDDLAVTLHIYRGPMTSCSVFRPREADWYERDQRQLSLDRTH